MLVSNVECIAKLKKYTIHLSTKPKKEEVHILDFEGRDACVITKMGLPSTFSSWHFKRKYIYVMKISFLFLIHFIGGISMS